MTVTVAEKPKGRKQSGALASRKISRDYIILNASGEVEARTELAAAVSATLDGLVIDSADVDEVYDGIFDGTVTWITQTRKDQQAEQQKEVDVETVVVSFDTTGGTAHVTRAESEIVYSPPGETAPESNLTVGLTDDGIQGVDVPAPALSWTETWQIARDEVTWNYIRFLHDLTGALNDATFRGFDVAEVRFLGATAQPNGDDLFSFTFKFAASPSVEGITIGEISDVYKRGWDYLWVRYESSVDDAAKKMTKRPIGVYVSQVSKLGDFSAIGIGTGEISL